MGVAKNKWSVFHHRDESCKVHDLLIRVAAVENSGEIEELRSLIYLSPESLFETLLRLALYGYLFD
jgi:hypothetical protein